MSAPSLFSIYFAVVFHEAFYENPNGIYIRYRTPGKVHNIRRLMVYKKVSSLVMEVLNADDCEIDKNSEDEMQCFMNRFAHACKALV